LLQVRIFSLCVSSDTAADLNAFSMRTILRCQALLSRKLMRPMSCNSLRHTRTAFSGPPPTEPAFEDFKPFSGGWNNQPREEIVPKEADLAIVGGGLVGLCTAFFIKHRFPRSFNVVVIEKDPLVRYPQYLRKYTVFQRKRSHARIFVTVFTAVQLFKPVCVDPVYTHISLIFWQLRKIFYVHLQF